MEHSNKKKQEKVDLICSTALEHFITTGKPIVISELAAECHTSAKTVKDALWDRHPDFGLCDVEVFTGDTWTGRYRLVQATQPSREYLARLLKAARQIKEEK